MRLYKYRTTNEPGEFDTFVKIWTEEKEPVEYQVIPFKNKFISDMEVVVQYDAVMTRSGVFVANVTLDDHVYFCPF